MTGLMKRSGKRTVCGMVSSRNRKPPCGKKLVWQRLCTMRRLLCVYRNRLLRESSGLACEVDDDPADLSLKTRLSTSEAQDAQVAMCRSAEVRCCDSSMPLAYLTISISSKCSPVGG